MKPAKLNPLRTWQNWTSYLMELDRLLTTFDLDRFTSLDSPHLRDFESFRRDWVQHLHTGTFHDVNSAAVHYWGNQSLNPSATAITNYFLRRRVRYAIRFLNKLTLPVTGNRCAVSGPRWFLRPRYIYTWLLLSIWPPEGDFAEPDLHVDYIYLVGPHRPPAAHRPTVLN